MHIKIKKIIKIKGGLGNQLFQYTYGRYLLKKNKKIVFDISFFRDQRSEMDTDRKFLLNNFNVIDSSHFSFVDESEIKKIIIKVLRKFKFKIDEYYQNLKYPHSIKSVLLNEISLLNPSNNYMNSLLKIKNNSLSLHVRHGDYLDNHKTKDFHGVLELDYYKSAYNKIRKNTEINQVIIFSDDSEWTKENFNFIDCEIIYASDLNLQDHEELILMSKCSHNIIANSTFSWWGAWLNQNPNKIVIAPKQWTTTRTSNELDILPKEWIQI